MRATDSPAKPKARRSPRPRPAVQPPKGDVQTERPGHGARRRAAKPTPVPRTFRSDSAQGGPSRAERRTIDANAKRVAAERQARARKKYFPKDPIKGVRKSQRRAVRALSDLYGSDPEKYERRRREARDPKVLGVNVGKAARAANRGLLGGAETLKREITKTERRDRSRPIKTSGLGAAPGKEILDIAANAPTSAYMAGAAAVEAAKGDSRRAKKLWQEFKDTSAVSAAVSGNLKEAAKRAHERPITTALELSGGKAVIGRTGGALARKAPLPNYRGFRDKVRKAGSTERANEKLYPEALGKGPEVGRKYSRDIINKGVQVAVEKRAARKGRKPGSARGPYVQQEFRPPPQFDRRSAVAKLRRRVDTRFFAQDRSATARKSAAEREMRHLANVTLPGRKPRRGSKRESRLPEFLRESPMYEFFKPYDIKTGRHTRPAKRTRDKAAGGIQLVAEGTARTTKTRHDLRVRLNDLARARKAGLEPSRLKLNRAEAAHIRKLLNLSDDQLAALAPAAAAVGKQQRAVQARGRRAGTWDETGMAKRWYPALQTRARRPKGEERRKYTPEEIRLAAKKLQQRYQRGKDLPTGATMAAMKAERDFEARMRAKVPGADMAAAVVAAASGRVPRVGAPKVVRRQDFKEYLSQQQRRVAVPERRFSPEELETVARVLQRRERRGKSTLEGMVEGGPAFVTQRPGRARTGSRLQGGAPFEPTRSRSGTAYEQGAREVGKQALVRQAVTSEAEVTAAEGWQLIDREFSVPAGADGRRYAASRRDAEARARELTLDEDGNLRPDAMPLVPVNIAQLQTFGARLRAKQEQGMPRSYAAINDLERQAWNDTWAAAMSESGRGKWALMPEDVVERIKDHASVRNFGPAHSLVNHFKDVVLTSSSPSRWLGGNAGDLSVRSALAGITPLDIVRGRMAVRRAAKQGLQGEQAAAAVSGGGLYHAAEALNRSFRPRGLHENPVRTVLATPWRVWKGGVYALEHALEELPQFGAVGKELRLEAGRSVPVKVKAPRGLASRIQRDGGITADVRGRSPDKGLSVAMHPDRERTHPADRLTDADVEHFMAQNADLLSQPDKYLGAWVNEGRVHLDVVSVVKSRRQAMKLARDNAQEAIFDLGKMEEIPTGLPAAARGPVKPLYEDATAFDATPKRLKYEDVEMKRDLKSMLKLHDQQIDHFANRLATDRAFEARIQGATESVIGRWGKISPALRRALVIAPFAQWLGAATRYVFITLPAEHPIKTGMLAGISEMTEQERAALGLSYFLPRNKQVYDYQMGSIPTKVGRNEYGPVVQGVRTSRMTSFGTAAGVPGNIGDFLLPQFAGALDAWAGTSFTHEPLVYPDWWPEVEKRRLPLPPDERNKIGLGALIEATVPFASAFRRAVVEGGAPAEPWSTVLTPATRKKWDKENKKFIESKGTALGGILEWLSPVAPEQRLYAHETGKAIEEQGITGEVLERWRKQPKRAKGFGFGGGSSRPKDVSAGFGDRGLRKAAEKTGYGF